MIKVSEFIDYLEQVNNQSSPAFLSFYNYLKNFINQDEDLTTENLENYFFSCLDYSHWASHKFELTEEIKRYLNQFIQSHQIDFDLEQVRWPSDSQVIEIENKADLVDVSERYVKSIVSLEDKFKIVPNQNNGVIAIILKKDRTLEVRTFDKKFTLNKGQLIPLRKELVLYFNSQLELSSEHTHCIEIAPYIWANFRFETGKVWGSIHRGYIFQKMQVLNGETLESISRLHIPIKRLEQYFVDRRTDTFYQKLLSQLERTRSLVHQGDKEAHRWSAILLAEAETALENIYIGDKMLGLLIRDLRFTAESRIHGREDMYPINQEIESDEDLEECLKISPLKKLDLTN